MATSTRVQILTDKVDELKVLKEYLDNPGLIQELEKEVIRLNALTEQEEQRLHESKILMQEKDKLKAEISAQERTLEKHKSDHEDMLKNNSENFQREMLEKTNRLEESHAALDERKAALDEFEKKLNQRENKLKEQAALIKGIIKD